MEPITAAIGLAITIFSAIAAKNQAIIDGLYAEKMQVKAAIEEMRTQINQLRLMRDGLRMEKAQLLGDRARAGMQGLGLLKSRQVKKEQVRLTFNEDLLQSLMEDATELSNEIGVLAGDVAALRNELGVREDEPLTLLEASINGGSTNKQMLLIVGAALGILALIAITKKREKETN